MCKNLAASRCAQSPDLVHFYSSMNPPMISVCVRIEPGADARTIQQIVVGSYGKIRPKSHPSLFWATTPLTLRNVRSIQGVKSCTLSPSSW